MVSIQESGVSIKERSLEGTPEGNHDGAKAPVKPDDKKKSIRQENIWGERSKWALGKVRGTFWIRVHEVPFWGFVLVKYQLRLVFISGFWVKWYRQARKWLT